MSLHRSSWGPKKQRVLLTLLNEFFKLLDVVGREWRSASFYHEPLFPAQIWKSRFISKTNFPKRGDDITGGSGPLGHSASNLCVTPPIRHGDCEKKNSMCPFIDGRRGSNGRQAHELCCAKLSRPIMTPQFRLYSRQLPHFRGGVMAANSSLGGYEEILAAV
jgi:hypothetical protein